MEAIFGVLAPVLVGSVALLLASLRFRQRVQWWQQAARAAGLTDVQVTTSWGWQAKLTGERAGLRVRLESYRHGKQEEGTRVVVGGLRHRPSELVVRAESVGTSLEKVFGDREIELGDDEFDRVAYVQGSPVLIRAVFDAPTRRLMTDLLSGRLQVPANGRRTLEGRASISDGELRVEIREKKFGQPSPDLPGALEVLLDLGQRLVRPQDPAAVTAANTPREAAPGVRLANLQLLAREYPAHPATRELLRAALDDESLVVRLQAAIELGSDGQATLLDIAGREHAPDRTAARAVVALGAAFPTARAIEGLQQALGSGRAAVALACVKALADRRDGPDEGIVQGLSRALAVGGPEVAAAAAHALGDRAGERVERALVAALGHESDDVRLAAAQALGRSGTPLAVVPLREAASGHPFDGTFRRAARQAIAGIQARVSGASPGQLSMAAETAGQVSLATDDEGGRLSLEP